MALVQIGQSLRGVTSWVTTSVFTGLKVSGKAALLYQIWDGVFSQILVVDTLRHGTNPINWFKIQLLGGDPNTGQNRSGLLCKGKLYVWRDSRRVANNWERVTVRVNGPLFYSGFIGGSSPDAKSLKVFFSWCVIRFHIRPQDENDRLYWNTSRDHHDYEDFYHNPRIPGTTLFTSKPLGWTHTGIFGSICQGVNGGLPRRISYNPRRFAKGLALSLIAIPLTAYWMSQLPVPEIADSRMIAWARLFASQLGYIIDQALEWKIVHYPLEGLRLWLQAESIDEVVQTMTVLGLVGLWPITF